MKSISGAMDSSWNSDPNLEYSRNSSPRSRLRNLEPDDYRVYSYIEHLTGCPEGRIDGF